MHQNGLKIYSHSTAPFIAIWRGCVLMHLLVRFNLRKTPTLGSFHGRLQKQPYINNRPYRAFDWCSFITTSGITL